MTYYQADDHWEDDKRLAGLAWQSFGTWHALQAFGSRELTDTIPPSIPFARFSKYAKPAAIARDRGALIESGLVEETADGGLLLVGFADVQGLETRRRRREADRLRKRQAREAAEAAEQPQGGREDASGTPEGIPQGSPEDARPEAESRSETQNTENVRADVRAPSVPQETETEREGEEDLRKLDLQDPRSVVVEKSPTDRPPEPATESEDADLGGNQENRRQAGDEENVARGQRPTDRLSVRERLDELAASDFPTPPPTPVGRSELNGKNNDDDELHDRDELDRLEQLDATEQARAGGDVDDEAAS